MFGVLAVNKPAGLTSRDVVNRVQRLVRPLKVGHTGTLDPMATGVLLVAVGPATRLVEFAHEAHKFYVGDFRLGETSETLDTEGTIESLENAPAVNSNELEGELKNWIGQIEQTPPKYSAIHIDGRRAYELARSGTEFEVPIRQVIIHALTVSYFEYPEFRIEIECGTGTYIRSLGNDIAQAIGSAAVMTGLIRTRIGAIELSDCCELDELRNCDDVTNRLIGPRCLLDALPTITLDGSKCQSIRNGIPVELNVQEQRVAACDSQGRLVAVLERTGGTTYRSLRVFQSAVADNQPNNTSNPHNAES